MKRNAIYKITAVCLCAVLCLGLFTGCESWNNFRKAFIDPPQPEELVIKIGVLEPQTGRRSYDAEDEVAGMELAYEMFPTAGDYRIELLYEDNNEVGKSNTWAENANEVLDKAKWRLDCIRRALIKIPAEYRQSTLDCISYNVPYGDMAHENTWRKWRQILIWELAKNLFLI